MKTIFTHGFWFFFVKQIIKTLAITLFEYSLKNNKFSVLNKFKYFTNTS